MNLKTKYSYKITIPESEFFEEEVKNIIILDKHDRVWLNYNEQLAKIVDDEWYYVADTTRDTCHWYKFNKEHKIEESI